MVRIISLAANFLALLVSTEACQGYFQCKYTDGSHCCVIFSSKGRDACPSYCNGATAGWDPECISTLTGNKRKLCDN